MEKQLSRRPRPGKPGRPFFTGMIFSAPVFGAVLTLGAALVLTSLLIVFNSPSPQRTLRAFFLGPWSSAWFLGNTLDSVGLLLTASLGSVLAFRGGTFNLGSEGQIYLGGLAAAAALLAFPGVPGGFLMITGALTAAAAGGFLGFLPGWIKLKVRAQEIITSFLLSAALSPLANYLIAGPWRDPSGNLLAMPGFAADRRLPGLLPPSNLNVSFIFALALVLAAHFFINKTVWGYGFRISGAAPRLARFGGIDPRGSWIPAMTAAGALSGLAGFFAVAGTYGRCHLAFPGGLGWNAIAVALIARNRPLALFPAALVYGWLRAGSESAQLAGGLGFETAAFIQALALILATARFRLRSGSRRERSKSGAPAGGDQG